MEYIIFDFEWNNAYDYKSQKGINEIIEIGAVKLDRNLNITDTFKQLIKPKISKKLSKRFRDLTSITQQEVSQYGIPFQEAFNDFARWSSGNNVLFMSWSNSDLYVLVSNYMKFLNTTSVCFIHKYMDVQKYCQEIMGLQNADQISLSHCAERLNISVEEENMHRALEDCYVAAECFKKLFRKNAVMKLTSVCDDDFFGRLAFKPYIITNPVSEFYNLYKDNFSCPLCGRSIKMVSDPELVNNSFKFVCSCKKCNKKFWIFVRVKKTYDGVSINKRIIPMNKIRAQNY